MLKEFLLGVAVLGGLDLIFQIVGYCRFKKKLREEG